MRKNGARRSARVLVPLAVALAVGVGIHPARRESVEQIASDREQRATGVSLSEWR
jgi:hypothetical protein